MLRRSAAAAFFAIEGLLDRIVCVLGALFFAQAPEFFQQYLQRLGGHLDEARRQLAAFDAAAHAAGKTLTDFASTTLANSDPGIAALGTTMRAAATRVDALAAAQASLAGASVWTRPFVFLSQVDWSIAHATAAVFKPAVPTTLEGAVYAAVGVAVAFAAWHFTLRRALRACLTARPAPAPVR